MTRTFIAHSPMGDQLEFRSLEALMATQIPPPMATSNSPT